MLKFLSKWGYRETNNSCAFKAVISRSTVKECVNRKCVFNSWCFCFSGFKRKQGGRSDSPPDNAKPRLSDGSDSGKREVMSLCSLIHYNGLSPDGSQIVMTGRMEIPATFCQKWTLFRQVHLPLFSAGRVRWWMLMYNTWFLQYVPLQIANINCCASDMKRSVKGQTSPQWSLLLKCFDKSVW